MVIEEQLLPSTIRKDPASLSVTYAQYDDDDTSTNSAIIMISKLTVRKMCLDSILSLGLLFLNTVHRTLVELSCFHFIGGAFFVKSFNRWYFFNGTVYHVLPTSIIITPNCPPSAAPYPSTTHSVSFVRARVARHSKKLINLRYVANQVRTGTGLISPTTRRIRIHLAFAFRI